MIIVVPFNRGHSVIVYEFGKHFLDDRKEENHRDFKDGYFYLKTKFFCVELLGIHEDCEIKSSRFSNSAGTAKHVWHLK